MSRALQPELVDHIMAEYEEAYLAANGRAIVLNYVSGWARSRHWGPYRIRELPKLTANLWARVHEQEITDATD